MAFHKDLSIPYHQQDTNYYCGAACAQMVLAGIGAGLIDQACLYADNQAHTIETFWATAPDGLQWTLNDKKPPSFAHGFVLFALETEDAISRKIVWAIHNSRAAPVALVHGWEHWITVRGCEASAAPTGSDDTSYTITSFDIGDPAPPVPTGAGFPPPHAGGDGCGTGGIRGVADQNIAYPTWQRDYMTGVPTGSYWTGKFVAVCDADPPATRIGNQARTRHRLKGERLLTPNEAAEHALAGLKEYGLLERESWKKSLAKTSPGEPVLVQRLDRLDCFYYIVPLQANRKAVPVLVSVDARFGDYLQALAVHERGGNALAGLSFDPKTALDRILGKRVELDRRKGQLLVRPEAFALYPALVWKPCRESLSPYYPFFMVTVGNQRIYIRVDGQVFTRLHDRDRGI